GSVRPLFDADQASAVKTAARPTRASATSALTAAGPKPEALQEERPAFTCSASDQRVIVRTKTAGASVNQQRRPRRCSQTETESSVRPARSWLLVPKS